MRRYRNGEQIRTSENHVVFCDLITKLKKFSKKNDRRPILTVNLREKLRVSASFSVSKEVLLKHDKKNWLVLRDIFRNYPYTTVTYSITFDFERREPVCRAIFSGAKVSPIIDLDRFVNIYKEQVLSLPKLEIARNEMTQAMDNLV